MSPWSSIEHPPAESKKTAPVQETSGLKEQEVLRVRAELMDAIQDYIKDNELTQKQAASEFGVSQPRISEIVQRKTDLFTVDKLIELLSRVNQRIEITLV